MSQSAAEPVQFKRVLKPEGLLVISTPDKHTYTDLAGQQNPHHVRELYREEFEALLSRHFDRHRLYGQRVVTHSMLWRLDGGTGVTITLIITVYVIVQVLETVVLTPTIMGREVELHPVTLIIALLLCGKLLGILGLILAVPIAATVRILARTYLWPRLRTWTEKGMDAVQPPPS